MREFYECYEVMTTDDGFCCVFNAVEQTELLKETVESIPYVFYLFK